jgi:hypothetical protein
LYSYRYNDKYESENYDLTLFAEGSELNLSRVVFLTSSSTASASEIVSSGLAPLMEVITVGSRTSGKPYVQRGRDRCGVQLNAIEAEGFNAAGVSVFGGMPATCYAEDDTSNGFGLNDDIRAVEGMLKAGLDYLVSGTCDSTTIAVARKSLIDQRQDPDASGRQGIVEMGGAIR